MTTENVSFSAKWLHSFEFLDCHLHFTMPFNFALSKVLPTMISNVLYHGISPPSKKKARMHDFVNAFDRKIWSSDEMEQKLNMHVQFKSIYAVKALKDPDIAVKKLIDLVHDAGVCDVDLSWFDASKVMDECINHNEKMEQLLLKTIETDCCNVPLKNKGSKCGKVCVPFT